MPIKRTFICPYCFKKSNMHELQFRCFNAKCEKVPDPEMTSYLTLGINNQEYTGRTVINATFTDDKTIPNSAICPKCQQQTYTYVCPKCHNTIPSSTLDGKDYVFSIVGARATGKSHVIAILINELMNNVCHAFNIDMNPFDDTLVRYREYYYDRVYCAKQTLLQTAKGTVALQNGSGKPLIFTLGFPSGLFGRSTEHITFAFYDAAGEDLASADDIYGNQNIAQSDGIIFIADPTQTPEISRHIEKSVLERASGGINSRDGNMTTANVLSNVTTFLRNSSGKRTGKLNVPLAVVLSKSDILLNIPHLNKDSVIFQPSPHRSVGKFVTSDAKLVDADVKGMLSSLGAQGLLTSISSNYSNANFFAMSALGNGNNPSDEGDINTPTPCRIEDAFLWLLSQKRLIKTTR